MTDDIDAKMARYEGDFLESSDLMHSPPVTVTIAEVVAPCEEKCANGRTIDKAILRFASAKKRFIVGKTNRRALKCLLGPKASGWIGQQVQIGVRYLDEAFGEPCVPALRVLFPEGVPVPASVKVHYGYDTPEQAREALQTKKSRRN